MERFVTDERTGLKYELVGDYPNPSHFITIKAQTMAFGGSPAARLPLWAARSPSC